MEAVKIPYVKKTTANINLYPMAFVPSRCRLSARYTVTERVFESGVVDHTMYAEDRLLNELKYALKHKVRIDVERNTFEMTRVYGASVYVFTQEELRDMIVRVATEAAQRTINNES